MEHRGFQLKFDFYFTDLQMKVKLFLKVLLTSKVLMFESLIEIFESLDKVSFVFDTNIF